MVDTLTERMVQELAGFRWLTQNSEGVAGLQIDGGVMPWPEVLDLYVTGSPKR